MRLCAVGCCPRCGSIQAFFSDYKTHKCVYCGKRFEVRRVRWTRSGLTPRQAKDYVEHAKKRGKELRIVRFTREDG